MQAREAVEVVGESGVHLAKEKKTQETRWEKKLKKFIDGVDVVGDCTGGGKE